MLHGSTRERIKKFKLKDNSDKQYLKEKWYDITVSLLNRLSIELQEIANNRYCTSHPATNNKPQMKITGTEYARYYGDHYVISETPVKFRFFIPIEVLKKMLDNANRKMLTGVHISIDSMFCGSEKIFDKELTVDVGYTVDEDIL